MVTKQPIVSDSGQLAELPSGNALGINITGAAADLSVLTVLGDIPYRNSTVTTRLPGNITTAQLFLCSQGNGAVAAAPSWQAITGFVPYTGAVSDVDLGAHSLTSTNITLSSLTASRILASDASKKIISLDTATYPSLTELSYVKGVTSAIQTQINAIAGGYVPYTGATADLNLGVHGLIATSLNISGTTILGSTVGIGVTPTAGLFESTSSVTVRNVASTLSTVISSSFPDISFYSDDPAILSVGINDAANPTNPGDAYIWQSANRNIRFGTSGVERMLLTGSGQLHAKVSITTPQLTISPTLITPPLNDIYITTSRGIIFENNNFVASNIYYDGSDFRYIADGGGLRYQQDSTGIAWSTAPDGLAGNVATLTSILLGSNFDNIIYIPVGLRPNDLVVKDDQFTLQNAIDDTKLGQFDLSQLTTAITRIYMLPDVDAPLVALSGISQRFELYTVEPNTIFLGRAAGNPSASGINNIVFGPGAGNAMTTASRCFIFGTDSGQILTAGDDNILMGYSCGSGITIGARNTAIATNAFSINIFTGNDNFVGGFHAGRSGTTFSNCVIIGSESAELLTSGDYNTLVGRGTGAALTTETGNVYLGFEAGRNHTVSNKLIIANSSTTTPIIFGDFSTNRLGFGGQNAPTALVHLAAGTAAAGTAPFKSTSGTVLTTPEAGAWEFDGTNFYLTPVSTRRTVALTSGMTTGSVLFATATNLIGEDNSNLFFDDSNNRLGIGTGASPQSRLHSTSTNGGSLSYALRLQNSSTTTTTSTGIAFATTTVSGLNKGGLVYVRTAVGNGRGDFYFLQNQVADGTTSASLSDVVANLTNRGSFLLGTNTDDGVNLLQVNGTISGTSFTGSAAKWTTARLLAGNSVDGSANVAFANKFIVQGTTDAGLSAAQFLGALGTGIVKNTTTTGVLSIAVAGDFPTLNQNTTGSAASLSISGQTGLLTFTGLTSTNRAKIVRDAADTILELGGSYTPTGTWTSLTMVTPVLGTPTSGVLTNCTGTAAGLTAGAATALATARTIGAVSFDGTANIVPQTIQSVNEATDTTCFPLFISGSGSQSLQPLNNAGLTYNASTNALGATLMVCGVGTNTKLLQFNSARSWNFTASGSGSSTGLDLTPEVDGKIFRIISQDASNTVFHADVNNSAIANVVLFNVSGGKVGIGLGSGSTAATLHLSRGAVATSGVLPYFQVDQKADTAQTAATESPTVLFNFDSATRSWAAGSTLATQRFFRIDQPTMAFDAASTVTDVATMGIVGAPVKGTNATVTNTHGILIGAGAVSTATNSYGLTVNAQTGATNNYAAQFQGSVGINQASPAASSTLDIVSTTQGILVPRMTTTQKNAISSPATGLELFDSTLAVKSLYNGAAWVGILAGSSGATAPSTTVGVAIVNFYGSAATSFLGTPNSWISVKTDNGNTYKIPAYS